MPKEADRIREIKPAQSSAADFSKNFHKRFENRMKEVKQQSRQLLENAKIIKDTGGFEYFTPYNQLLYRQDTSKFFSDLQGIITDIKMYSGHDMKKLEEVETIAEDVLRAYPFLHNDVRQGYTSDLGVHLRKLPTLFRTTKGDIVSSYIPSVIQIQREAFSSLSMRNKGVLEKETDQS